jgi:HAD superfamily hydrolase (TIGR01484 family)
LKPFAPKIVFSDFDGTLTEGHRLGPQFFDILNLCEKSKVPFIVVTGRSVQWAYFVLTHFDWPVHFIAEGGGVWVQKHSQQNLETKILISTAEKLLLEKTAIELRERYRIELSADSSGRMTDRAIELEVFKNNNELKLDVQKFLKSSGLESTCSNVHLNFWAGKVSKANAMKHLMSKEFSSLNEKDTLFFGDSLNDESVFKDFSHTVGVSNIDRVIAQLKSQPSLVLKGSENEGPKGVYSFLSDWLK